MASAMPDEVEDEIIDLLGCKHEDIIRASGKTGMGVEAVSYTHLPFGRPPNFPVASPCFHSLMLPKCFLPPPARPNTSTLYWLLSLIHILYNVLYLCISRLLEETYMFLEHLASYNEADMHKYNTLYTRKLSWHVLTPTSCI